MKNFRLLTLLGIALFATTLAGCGNNNQTPTDVNQGNGDIIIEDVTQAHDAVIDYNDSLVDIASQCIMSEDAILTNYENGSEEIQAAIDNTVSICQNSINQINELGDWEGDSSLKDGVIRILELDIAYFTKFSELLPYLTAEELPEAEAEKYDALVDEINALDLEMQEANNDLITIQETFAANHDYELQPTEEA